MDGFGGGTRGYWRNRYYTRLDADDVDGEEQLPGGAAAAKPPSGRRRKPPSSRRPKVVRVAPPPVAQPSSFAGPPTAPEAAAASSFSVASSISQPPTLGRPRRRRRFWRIRLAPRLAFLRRVASAPARLLRGIQRGYVRMMLRFAGAMGGSTAPGMMGGYPLPRPSLKEYDEKVLVEIYRALVAQGQVLVVPADGGGVAAARLVAR